MKLATYWILNDLLFVVRWHTHTHTHNTTPYKGWCDDGMIGIWSPNYTSNLSMFLFKEFCTLLNLIRFILLLYFCEFWFWFRHLFPLPHLFFFVFFRTLQQKEIHQLLRYRKKDPNTLGEETLKHTSTSHTFQIKNHHLLGVVWKPPVFRLSASRTWLCDESLAGFEARPKKTTHLWKGPGFRGSTKHSPAVKWTQTLSPYVSFREKWWKNRGKEPAIAMWSLIREGNSRWKQPTPREEEVEIPAIDPRVVTIREALSSVKVGFVNQASPYLASCETTNLAIQVTTRMVELHIL